MKTILIPTDFSESSFNAAHYAACVTNQLNVSTLILYHSNPVPHRATEISILHEHTLELLESFKKRVQPFIHKRTQIDILIDELPLSVAIENIIERRRVDLVVMATTGKSNLERVFAGSNTVTVARECSAPLLLVPKEAKFEEIEKVLFATDLKDVYNTTPVEAIRKFIQLFNARLVVAHVSNLENAGSEPDLNSEQDALQLLFEQEQPEYHFINANGPVRGIMELAATNQIQLIAIVPKKLGFLEGIFHHSMTSEFAYHTYLPLLLLK